ncbi:hypothetical protein MtrunA17_Chr7g0229681 [Medicago truncatula]|uniref:Transmembrane protein n=1 Tax=Medicago truncatula TaxID=3880 RepID=A0A396GWC9_MEDTR|nr:hypothetical protein MtrunA17_Chr7g0229681 [Medicago truncatula]
MAKTLTLFLLFLQLTYFTAFSEEEFDIGGGGGGFRMPLTKPPSGLKPLLRHMPPVKNNAPPVNVNHPVPSKPNVENNPPSSHYGQA